MPKKAKPAHPFDSKFILPPAIAYACYGLLLILSLLTQQGGSSGVNFMFLTFWGIVTFFVAVVTSLLGFIKQAKIRHYLFLINLSVALTIAFLSLSAAVIVQQGTKLQYQCHDYVRCIFN
jgi:hypothetical protein